MEKQEKQLILDALKEDLGFEGDITTDCLIEEDHNSQFSLIVNEDSILAGIEVFTNSFLLKDATVQIDPKFNDGSVLKAKNTVAFIKGHSSSILASERVALNYISYLSGIATITCKLKTLIQHTKVELLDTRKTIPLTRAFERKAVVVGGGSNHRFSLSDMVLIKDNHISLVGNIKNAINKARAQYGNKYKIEVEVETMHQLEDAIPCKPDIIMFDNWKPSSLKEALSLVPKDILTEASGQISEENIRAYAECGVNYISTSYMVKNAKWIDFSLEVVS